MRVSPQEVSRKALDSATALKARMPLISAVAWRIYYRWHRVFSLFTGG